MTGGLILRLTRPLMPRDTRAVELASAFALLAAGVQFMGGEAPAALLAHHPAMAWGVMTLVMGALQLAGVAAQGRLEVLRSLMAWACGLWWVYLGLSDGHLRPDDWPALTVGLGNLYAFAITINLYLEGRRPDAHTGGDHD